MQGSALHLVFHAGLLVKFVLLILAFFSTYSWSIILYKHYYFRLATKETDTFIRRFEADQSLKALADVAAALRVSPLANVFNAVYPHHGALHPEELRRALRRYEALQTERLHAYLTFLATTGSTTPFIGLLGTVWGIMNAFRGIGATGSASLAVVAPGIAEALITTAAGLGAAIPAVIAYNYYLSRARRLTVEMEDFSEEFLDVLSKKSR